MRHLLPYFTSTMTSPLARSAIPHNAPEALSVLDDTQSVFFCDTDLVEFSKTPRPRGASPFFDYWLPRNRLYVTVGTMDYEATLMSMMPGSVVIAYESRKGIVASGIVASDPDRQQSGGGTQLHPDPDVTVKSIAVHWDGSVTMDYRVASTAKVAASGVALRSASPAWRALLADIMAGPESHACEMNVADVAARLQRDPSYSNYERLQLDRARIGQGVFRANVLQLESSCRLTAIANPRYLIASHIKPWRLCEGLEHIDGHNGLMLTPNADHLFDAGLMSFSNEGQPMLSHSVSNALFASLGLGRDIQVRTFSTKQKHYLDYHRNHIFRPA